MFFASFFQNSQNKPTWLTWSIVSACCLQQVTFWKARGVTYIVKTWHDHVTIRRANARFQFAAKLAVVWCAFLSGPSLLVSGRIFSFRHDFLNRDIATNLVALLDHPTWRYFSLGSMGLPSLYPFLQFSSLDSQAASHCNDESRSAIVEIYFPRHASHSAARCHVQQPERPKAQSCSQ